MNQDEEKRVRQIHTLARRLPYIVIGCVILTVIAVYIELWWGSTK